ncbi:Putative ribonuclease H protein At1g65750, partial [Linum perenne]
SSRGTIVRKFRLLLHREWRAVVKHVFREANHLADALASKGHNLEFGTHSIDNSNSEIRYWTQYDIWGGTETRRVIAM